MGTEYFQVDATESDDLIGVELEDPPPFAGTLGPYACPPGQTCRLSDAALFDYVTDDAAPATIARTNSRTRYRDANVLDEMKIDGELNIVGKELFALQGLPLQKIGRTTGWTFGFVEDTCTDIRPGGSPYFILCSSKVSMGGLRGDSGSPVFFQETTSDVRLAGILFASDLQNFVWFSPITEIENEFRQFKVTNLEEPLEVDIDGPSVINSPGTYAWEADPSGGPGTFTYQWFVDWASGGTDELGTNKSQSLSVNELSDDTFTIRVEVESGTHSQEALKFVLVNIGCNPDEIFC